MSEGQGLSELTANLLVNTDGYLEEAKPELIIAQGDTSSVLAIALAGFYRKIPFAHVEAGLRTGNFDSPFPEEFNRVFAGTVAKLHFAPTEAARQNLLQEGIPDKRIHVTGNTGIDALHENIPSETFQLDLPIDDEKVLIIVTAHRRESFGAPIENICKAVRKIAETNPGVQILWPVHPNPNISPVVNEMLDGCDRVILSKPLGYGSFVTAMNRAQFLITDSGGVQEEACALGKPVLIVREVTDRGEAVEAGASILVGRSTQAIIEGVEQLLSDSGLHQQMVNAKSIYGDGKAAGRIVKIVGRFLDSGAAC